MDIFKNKNKAFTIIEILVVISIIGLLASIILINVNKVKERARIAKALQFSKSIHNAVGAYGITFFDSTNENPRHLNNNEMIKDSSGGDNNGIIKYNGAGSADIVSNCINGNCLNLSNGGPYDPYLGVGLWVPNSSKLNCVDKITIQAWINPSDFTWLRTIVDRHYNDDSLGQEGSSYSLFFFPVEGGEAAILFCLRFEGDTQSSCVGSNKLIELNKWQHVATTYNGSCMKLFIDGEETGRLDISGNKKIIQSTYPIGIGVMSGGIFKQYFAGSIDEVFIYCDAF